MLKIKTFKKNEFNLKIDNFVADLNDIVKFLSIYIYFNYTEKDAHNPRVSQIPFTKWYIKNYHNKYNIEQIFEAYNDNGETKINKNLKSRLKNYTFIKI